VSLILKDEKLYRMLITFKITFYRHPSL